MEPAQAMQVNLKPGLFFEWQGSEDSSPSIEEIVIILGNKTFQALIPNATPANARAPLAFTAQDCTEKSIQRELMLSPQERETLQLFARVKRSISNVQMLIDHPIAIEMPKTLQHQDCCVRITSQNGKFKASIEPKNISPVFQELCYVVFDTMYGALKGYFRNLPQAKNSPEILLPALARCCERSLGKEGLNTFIQKLDPFLLNFKAHGNPASPPIMLLAYQTLGKVNMRALMCLLVRTSYPAETIPKIQQGLPGAFSFFASVFDPNEKNAMNQLFQHLYYVQASIERSQSKKG